MCGSRGKKLKKMAADNNITIRKVSFASEEGKELSHIAVFKKGIKKMPFFTDGDNYAEKIESLICKKATPKTRKDKKKGDGDEMVG